MFDENRAEYVCAFVELLPFGTGEWAGKPFRLQGWQRDPLREFYGNVEADPGGTKFRIYQYLYLEIPKKNGKSELSASLGLYHLLGDGERNPQVYICAADKENASIVFNAMCAMADARPWIAKRVKQVPSRKEVRLGTLSLIHI